jgi:dihydropteroate synthase
MTFNARQFAFHFPRPMLVMGIVNVTPDSFSDGGDYFDLEAAVAHGLAQVAQGADLLDIGGESTRPGAQLVTEEEELRRVVPVVERLAAQTRVPLSVDTVKPAVARAALAAGASIVNDVGAFRANREMGLTVAEFRAGYVLMHALGLPGIMPAESTGGDVVRAVNEFFSARLAMLVDECGLAPEQVVLDPGIGFGKTLAENLQLLGNLGSFTKWGRPLLLGVSRKSFIGKVTGAGLAERLPGSLACAALAVPSGVNLVRVHDVAETVQAVRVAEAIVQKSNVD